MHDTTAIVPQDDEDKQHPEGGRRQREEVDGHRRAGAVAALAALTAGGRGY